VAKEILIVKMYFTFPLTHFTAHLFRNTDGGRQQILNSELALSLRPTH